MGRCFKLKINGTSCSTWSKKHWNLVKLTYHTLTSALKDLKCQCVLLKVYHLAMLTIGSTLKGLHWMKVNALIRWVYSEVPFLIVVYHKNSVCIPAKSPTGIKSSAQPGTELDEPKVLTSRKQWIDHMTATERCVVKRWTPKLKEVVSAQKLEVALSVFHVGNRHITCLKIK